MKRMDEQIRQQVFERDNYTCRYCGSTQPPLHADHVYPWSKGGETSINNLVTACRKCNGKKSNKVGVWPLSTEYIDRMENKRKLEVAKEKQNSAIMFYNLLVSGILIFIDSMTGFTIPLIARIVVYIWFLLYASYGMSLLFDFGAKK